MRTTIRVSLTLNGYVVRARIVSWISVLVRVPRHVRLPTLAMRLLERGVTLIGLEGL